MQDANPQQQYRDLDLTAERTDPLLSSLVFLSKYYGKPFSARALSAGLPLEEGLLTPALLPRAALRAGMDASIVKKPINKIPELLLPCILLLKDGRSCVLLSRTEEGIEVAWPELPDSHEHISLDKLEPDYTGFCCYVRKRYRFDARSPESLSNKQGHWFWNTLRRSAPIYRDALVASLFLNLFAIASPLFVMNVYDRVVPNSAIDTLWVLTAGMALVLVFDFALKQMRAYTLDLAAKKSDILLSARIFEKLLNIKAEVRPPSVGAFAKNVQEFDSIREFVTSSTIAALIDVPFSLLFLLVIAMVAGPLALVPAGAALLMLLYSFYIKRKMHQEVELGSRFASQKNAHLIESLNGIESLKLAGAESQFQHKWEELVGNIATWNMAIRKLATSVGNVNAFVSQSTTVLIVVVGVFQISQGELSMGGLVAAVMLTGRALVPFSQVSLLATRYNQAQSALENLEDIMQLPDENLERYMHRSHFDGAISFTDVSFTYPGSDQQVLKNVSFSLKAKEKVAIIGKIGAGKTSLEKVLLGFYTPQHGAIRLDGVDLNQISPADIRQKMGCLPQDINLFFGSIRENITLGVPHIEDELIFRAAELAGVTQFTDVDPEGLDRQVGERGQYLSGGQRQAVALARALLFNPPVLVLDEPTSSMDAYSENLVKKRLKQVAEDKTFVLITHKMSMLDLVDRIIVLERGQVVADGRKEEVLELLRSGKVRAPNE
ncbi:type I secretion system permease/ATPase [Agarivorans sp. B2Z047]|uniref:type I secretion system permease/ATPase n=1 Tax=Agarivorans sp. B2Z047 TaxID=2652721 RepID=UPI0014070AF1|nr:type I secretion system permease/ATPase [Agarivorans sp. B2Z047]MPW28205.1 type I secretion system permease/ATPase [Agarivorans sp. B2Z047]UQN43964.1 type I secretion system permease/ATPase [Agarivorans sp. B2Z047]